MVQNPPAGTQRVVPYIAYNDAPDALDFLTTTFGFEERFRMPMPDGTIGHAEIGYQDNVVMVASANDELGFASPMELKKSTALILCYVDDVDAHFEVAKAAGATIIGEPEDQPYGDRSYRAADPEGHKWFFATHVRDVDPSEMKGS